MGAEASSQDRAINASLPEQGRTPAHGTWQRDTGAPHGPSHRSVPQLRRKEEDTGLEAAQWLPSGRAKTRNQP